jgi:hypothetical protein
VTQDPDRLYNLLPAVYRQRDIEQGGPLQALLRVISEQVNVVDSDIAHLYRNWFIETCDDWVVPYIADLIGYQPVNQGDLSAGSVSTALSRILVPRREVAGFIGFRRRKGTLALLEQLAGAVAGWPARVVEFDRYLSVTQSIDHLHQGRARTTDLRSGGALDLLGTPFDSLSHTLDLRRVNSFRTPGLYSVPTVAVFVWRLRIYSVTRALAYLVEEAGDHCYTFSILGNDTPLYNLAAAEADPTDIAGELNLPTPIRRRAFADRTVTAGVERFQASTQYYGEGKSLAIWAAGWAGTDPAKPVPADMIIPADLSGWKYRPRHGYIAVDPELGRIAFPPTQLPGQGVHVSYHYGFSADIGGGEYSRPVILPAKAVIYPVGPEAEFRRIRAAYEQWLKDKPAAGVIEVTDSGVYEEQIHIEVGAGRSLEIRAAPGARPVILLIDWRAARPDALTVTGEPGASFSLDGLLIAGRGIEVRGRMDAVTIRHSTLVPGWALHPEGKPRRATEASLSLVNTTAKIRIAHCIVGQIHVLEEEVDRDPVSISISDSIIDATSRDLHALNGPDLSIAPVVLEIACSTVLGRTSVHAISLAENCIFASEVIVARRQLGCMRFCYVPPGSRTPRRFECQPDLVEKAVAHEAREDRLPDAERDALREAECLRVDPRFITTRYGKPEYCRLSENCAEEIARGAEDESEMGAFHDLYQPQGAANLKYRLEEYTPAGVESGIVYAS